MASSKLSLCAIHYRHTTKLIYSILFHTIQEQSPKPLDFSNNTTRKGGKSTSIQNHTALTPLRKLPFSLITGRKIHHVKIHGVHKRRR